MATWKNPGEGPDTRSDVRLVLGEGSNTPANAQAPADGQERMSEQMRQAASRQASAEVCQEHECQAEEAQLMNVELSRKLRSVNAKASAELKSKLSCASVNAASMSRWPR